MSSAPGLESGLRIIELVIKSGDSAGIGFNQLKQELDLNAASLNRYLKVLLEAHFVSKGENQLYIPGAKLMHLSNMVKEFGGKGPITSAVLEQISTRTGFTSLWIDYREGRMHCLDKHIAPEGIVMQEIGEVRTDYILHPWGLLWLAELPTEDRKFLIENANLGSFRGIPLNAEQLEQFIANAAQGWVDDFGLIYRGIRKVAVGIRFEGKLIASIAVGMPGTLWDDETLLGIVKVLKENAAQIEEMLDRKKVNKPEG
jgi:DNA-binding IclR family transcriptional regulator